MLLRCPCCNEPKATIQCSIGEKGEFFCCECEDTFDVDAIKEMMESMKKWEQILEWVEKMPTDE